MIFIALIIALSAAAIAYIYLQDERRKYKNLPPGPKGLPIIGNLLQFGGGKLQPHEQAALWTKEFGEIFYAKIGTAKMIFLNNPKYVREIFNRSEYTGRWDFDNVNDIFDNPIRAHGVINTSGEDWEQLRRFTLRQLRDFGFGKQTMENYIRDEVSELIETLKSTNEEPQGDLQRKLTLIVVNALWTIVSGKRHNHDDPYLTNMTARLHKANVEGAEKAGVLFLLPKLRHIIPQWSGYKAMREAFAEYRNFFRKTVQEHEETYSSDTSRDFIDVFLKEIKSTSESEPSSPFYGQEGHDQLLGVISDLFTAGTDTTSSTLAWALLYLSKKEEIQRKLQDEIESVTNNSRFCSLSDRPNMPYMEAVLSEVFRYSALIPMGAPHKALVTKEYLGYDIPKDFLLVSNTYFIHFDPKNWGPDPEVFRPERFIDANNKYKKHEALLPFSVGRRQCLGETLARDSLFLFISNIFQRFHVQLHGDQDFEPARGFILMPKPFKCIFKERK